MTAQPPPGGDELRTRHHLRRLGARPFGHQDNPMPDRRPVTPTRIIPAGAPLPERAPEPGEIPPWRTPPAPPPTPPAPPPPPPAPIEVRHVHVHEVLLVTPEPEEPPPLWARIWDWAWERLVTWRMLLAILAAFIPWTGGRSPVGAWAHTLHQARTEAGIGTAYFIAGIALAAAWTLNRTGRAFPRFLLVTALLGSLGVLDWYDPITALTGVLR
ncbi:hypothetical protein [Streptomyces acidiscabies]|uniref:Uncharacterized protein n=1 Tax=Streptomyces acidiscabies TaxID=42234 RepID=A0ABU4LW37_9ACTN|nr:hypothetical protein [Streptomyces acidiscabies]MDX3019878.1 hypothetical protein [Streptomyces acidiscabies]